MKAVIRARKVSNMNEKAVKIKIPNKQQQQQQQKRAAYTGSRSNMSKIKGKK